MSRGIAEKIIGHCFFTFAGRDRTWRFYREPCGGSAVLSWLNYGQTFDLQIRSCWILESWSLHSDSVSRLRSQALLVY